MFIAVWRAILCLWLISVLLVISFPWSKFDGTSHWENVLWVPFSGFVFTAPTIVETALNVLAFIPVGYLAIRSFSLSTQRPLLLALLLGFCSSVGIEFYQLFCHDRVASATDVFLNLAGTVIGAWLAVAIDQTLTFCALLLRRLSL